MGGFDNEHKMNKIDIILHGWTGYNHVFFSGERYYFLGILFLINYKKKKNTIYPKIISF